MSTTNKALILGAGYLGQHLILPLKNLGFLVDTVTRHSTPESQEAHQHYLCDSTPQLKHIISSSRPDVLIVCWAPGSRSRDSQNTYQQTYWESLLALKSVLAEGHRPQKIIYTSSTSVYHEQDGSLKNESHSLSNHSERAKTLINAEKEFLSWQSELSIQVQILRCSGIFGPDRWPGLRALKSNATISGNAQAWVNLVHVEDIVQAILLGLNSDQAGLWNLSAISIRRKELYESIAKQHQLKKPVWEFDKATDIGRRIDASKIKQELNWNPKFLSL